MKFTHSKIPMDDVTYASTHKWIFGCAAIFCLAIWIALISFVIWLLFRTSPDG